MQRVTAEQLKKMQGDVDNLLLVNTLPQEHFAATKIEGAVNIPEQHEDFAGQVENRLGGKHKPVVVYCANESCDSSLHAAEKLDAAGFEHVYEFTDGAEGWKACCAPAAASTC